MQHFFFFTVSYLVDGVGLPIYTASMRRSEENWGELVLLSYHAGPEDGAQVVRLAGKHL